MLYFLLGVFTTDLLFALIIFLKKEVFFNLNRNYIVFSIIIDIIFISFILYFLKNERTKNLRKS